MTEEKTVTVKLIPPFNRFHYDGVFITGDEVKAVLLGVYEANSNKLTLVETTIEEGKP